MDKHTQKYKHNQKLLQDEFQKYKDKKSTYKSYMQSMDDILNWIQERDK